MRLSSFMKLPAPGNKDLPKNETSMDINNSDDQQTAAKLWLKKVLLAWEDPFWAAGIAFLIYFLIASLFRSPWSSSEFPCQYHGGCYRNGRQGKLAEQSLHTLFSMHLH